MNPVEVAAAVHRRLVAEPPAIDDALRVRQMVRDEAPLASPEALDRLEQSVLSTLRGLGPIDALLADPEVTDVLINGSGEVWIERDGDLRATPLVLESATVRAIIERIFRPLGVPIDLAHPNADGQLVDGSRVTAVLPPISVDGPILAIRRFRTEQLPLEAFAAPETVGLLRSVVVDRDDVIVFGATGSGKTTLVNSLASIAARSARLVVIEDVPELRIVGPQVVRLQVQAPGEHRPVTGRTLRDLVRLALRLRPDRIVVGEVRGPEAHDMLWALATGHSGSFSTVHASSPGGALGRLCTFAAMASSASEATIRSEVAAAVDVLVGMKRLADGRRVVDSLSRVADDGMIIPIPIRVLT